MAQEKSDKPVDERLDERPSDTGTPVDVQEQRSNRVLMKAEKLIYGYRASHVQRWHCRGHMLRADYVGRHSHGVAVIIATLNEDPSAELLKAALYHDLGEFAVGGDLEHRPGRENRKLYAAIDKLEQEELWQHGYQTFLSNEDHAWLKAADALDAWMVIYENIICGNSMLSGSYTRCTEKITKECSSGNWPEIIGNAMLEMMPFHKWSED